MLDTNGAVSNVIRDVKISDIDMSGALATGTTAIFLQKYRTFVVLVDDVMAHLVTLSIEKMVRP